MNLPKLNKLIDSLELIESELNQDTPNISDVRIELSVLLTELNTERSIKEEKFLGSIFNTAASAE